MPRLFLGVDGGQSSTTALIGDESGHVVGQGHAGPCNHVETADAHAKLITVVESCVAAACAQAGLDPASVRFDSAYLGLSGGPEDKEAILREILRADRLTVGNDALIALSGALVGDPGVVVIAGTGSIAFGRNAAGKTIRVGGWGHIFGDEGSAFDIVRQAVRSALRYEETWGPATSLRDALLHETGASSANDLLHRFYTSEYPRSRVASMAPLVDQEAVKGDAAAIDILEEAAECLMTLAAMSLRQLFADNVRAVVSYSGGVFRSTRLLDHFRKKLQAMKKTTVVPPVYGPAAGALIEAYRAAGAPLLLSEVPEVEK